MLRTSAPLIGALGVMATNRMNPWLHSRWCPDSLKGIPAITALSVVLIAVAIPGIANAQSDQAGRSYVDNVPLPPKNLRYPVIDNAKSIRESFGKSDASTYVPSSLEGVIKTLVLNDRKQPIIEIQVDDQASVALSTAWAIPIRDDRFPKVGDRVRVLGWLAKTADWKSLIGVETPREQPLFLLAICIVQASTLDAIFDKKYVEYCDGWERAILPPTMQDKK